MTTPPSPPHITNIMRWGNKILSNAGIENAKNEMRWFITSQFKISPTDYISNHYIFKKLEIKIIENFINRRLQHEPFQYIMETAPFYNKNFYVNNKVLIPRPETEIIIDVLKKQKIFKRALDVGTGSGNLAIMLRLEKIALEVIGIDISQKALQTAKRNAQHHSVSNIQFKHHDFLNEPIHKKYDLIVCNPPYISSKEYKKLNLEIRNFEPPIALTDFSDGFIFYEKFALILKNILTSNGILLLEIGKESTKSKIETIFKQYASSFKWFKDYNNNFRILKISHE